MDQDQEEEAVIVGVVAAAAVVMEVVAVVEEDTDLLAVETDRTISRYSCVIYSPNHFDICLQVWATSTHRLSSACGEFVESCQLAGMYPRDCAMCIDVCMFHSGLMCVCGLVCV